MSNQNFEEMFDNLIKEAGIIAIEEMEKEYSKELDNLSKVKFSKRHEKRMKKFFEELKNKQK